MRLMKRPVLTPAIRNAVSKFFDAHGVQITDDTPVTVCDSKQYHARIGAQSAVLKRRLKKAGWVAEKPENFGGGERCSDFTHPDLASSLISIHEFSGRGAYLNKVYLTQF